MLCGVNMHGSRSVRFSNEPLRTHTELLREVKEAIGEQNFPPSSYASLSSATPLKAGEPDTCIISQIAYQ